MTTNIADRFAEAQTTWINLPTLWVETGNEWTAVDTYADAYEAMTPLAMVSDKPAVLEMYGTMTKLDEDEMPTDESERVRLLFAVLGDNYEVLVQRKDGESFSDPTAQGMFLDLFLATKDLLGR